MEKLLVEKSPPLKGRVRVGGSKNAVLPVLAATLLTDERCVIEDVPSLSDVSVMEELLAGFGAQGGWDRQTGRVTLSCPKLSKDPAAYALVSKMRASFLLMGPVLARNGSVSIPMPGGCAIGARPVELHLKGFAALGADISTGRGFVSASCKRLKGSKVYLDFPSVGATENIMMAACLAKGQTVLENCAVEPEVVDLANFLNAMGAEVKGAGTDTIRVNGVKQLGGATHTIIPDRIEAGTFMIAAAMTKGDVTLENVVWDHLKPITAKLIETNAKVEPVENGLRVSAAGKHPSKAVDVKTLPYPGFPTDLQAQFMSLLTLSEGTSVVTETVFENRFMHVGELKRLGADIRIESRTAVIEGVKGLTGSEVRATDLRAGAALVLSGLMADGQTKIGDVQHIDRGYCGFEKKLAALGAKISRADMELS